MGRDHGLESQSAFRPERKEALTSLPLPPSLPIQSLPWAPLPQGPTSKMDQRGGGERTEGALGYGVGLREGRGPWGDTGHPDEGQAA